MKRLFYLTIDHFFVILTLLNMAVPRSHLAKGRQGRRRSHLALKKTSLVDCSNCKKSKTPHTICKSCGYYNGREVVNVMAKELKKQEKEKAKRKS
jgi:large subunit ribosomal protein L32